MNFSTTVIKDDTNLRINNYLPKIGKESMVKEILDGLNSTPKTISSKYFYDAAGSKLFEEITHLPEYYQTRTEIALIKQTAKRLHLESTDIIEIGSGDYRKIFILLSEIPEETIKTIQYIPVDLSQTALEKSTQLLAEKFPDLHIHAIVADFTHQKKIIPPGSKKLFCFFGSTIGNYPRNEALKLISHFDDSMQPGDRLLLGLDRVKNKQVVEKAYNDSSNITARFNKNILNVVNNIAGTNFNTEDFDHQAFYNETLNRIEMHLKAKRKMEISSPHSKNNIVIEPNETIHTENSYKFLDSDINEFQNRSGLEIEEIISDENKWFSLAQFVKKSN